MAPIPIEQTPTVNMAERFEQLASAWQRAVAHHSSSTVRYSHPLYQEIVSLGPEVVPCLLRDLAEHQTHWFAALRQLTGANPVPAEAVGNISLMVAAWLSWAREQGYQW